MCSSVLNPSELGLAGWITGYKKELSHGIVTSHKPYSGDQHLLHKVLSSFQGPDKEWTILSEIQTPLCTEPGNDSFQNSIEENKKTHF